MIETKRPQKPEKQARDERHVSDQGHESRNNHPDERQSRQVEKEGKHEKILEKNISQEMKRNNFRIEQKGLHEMSSGLDQPTPLSNHEVGSKRLSHNKETTEPVLVEHPETISLKQ